jgi:Dimerisation domain
MQMATGYWVSKTLMTAVELGVFTKISEHKNKSITLAEFQNIIGTESRPAEALTTARIIKRK